MPIKTPTTVDVEAQLQLLEPMLRIRAFETAANQLYLSEKMPGLTHLYIGEVERDTVTKGEPLMEIETDKVTVEIEAPADGTLTGISAAEGEDVPVGRAVAFVPAQGEDLPETVAIVAAPARSASPAVVATTNGSSTAFESPARRVLASPKARRLAREHGVRIEDLQGTGPHGAVQAADVVAQEARAVGEERAAPAQPVMSNAWKTMAARMQEAWREVPHVFLERDLDATRLSSWRETIRRRAGYERTRLRRRFSRSAGFSIGSSQSTASPRSDR
jgi:pyruvate/2-oxoglutarate dehydrogenase complex dihydrolipoamide acyltransferase (E2) component